MQIVQTCKLVYGPRLQKYQGESLNIAWTKIDCISNVIHSLTKSKEVLDKEYKTGVALHFDMLRIWHANNPYVKY